MYYSLSKQEKEQNLNVVKQKLSNSSIQFLTTTSNNKIVKNNDKDIYWTTMYYEFGEIL